MAKKLRPFKVKHKPCRILLESSSFFSQLYIPANSSSDSFGWSIDGECIGWLFDRRIAPSRARACCVVFALINRGGRSSLTILIRRCRHLFATADIKVSVVHSKLNMIASILRTLVVVPTRRRFMDLEDLQNKRSYENAAERHWRRTTEKCGTRKSG